MQLWQIDPCFISVNLKRRISLSIIVWGDGNKNNSGTTLEVRYVLEVIMVVEVVRVVHVFSSRQSCSGKTLKLSGFDFQVNVNMEWMGRASGCWRTRRLWICSSNAKHSLYIWASRCEWVCMYSMYAVCFWLDYLSLDLLWMFEGIWGWKFSSASTHSLHSLTSSLTDFELQTFSIICFEVRRWTWQWFISTRTIPTWKWDIETLNHAVESLFLNARCDIGGNWNF